MHDENAMRNFAILKNKAKEQGKKEWSVTVGAPEPKLADTRNSTLSELDRRLNEDWFSQPPITGYGAELQWVNQLKAVVSGKGETLRNYDPKISYRWLVVADNSAWRMYIDSEFWDVLLDYLRKETGTISSQDGFERVLVLTRDRKMLEIVGEEVREYTVIDYWPEFIS